MVTRRRNYLASVELYGPATRTPTRQSRHSSRASQVRSLPGKKKICPVIKGRSVGSLSQRSRLTQAAKVIPLPRDDSLLQHFGELRLHELGDIEGNFLAGSSPGGSHLRGRPPADSSINNAKPGN